jgi:hypothetical protein
VYELLQDRYCIFSDRHIDLLGECVEVRDVLRVCIQRCQGRVPRLPLVLQKKSAAQGDDSSHQEGNCIVSLLFENSTCFRRRSPSSAMRPLLNARGCRGTRRIYKAPNTRAKVQRGDDEPGDSTAPATLMDPGGVLMTLRVKEPCCDEGGNCFAQNLLACLTLTWLPLLQRLISSTEFTNSFSTFSRLRRVVRDFEPVFDTCRSS